MRTRLVPLLAALALLAVPLATTAATASQPAVFSPLPDQRLTAEDPSLGEEFGYGLALDGDQAAVLTLGKTHIYTHMDETWTRTHLLDDSSDGEAITLDNGTLTLGSPGIEEIRVYEQQPDGWKHIQTLTTPSGQDDLFGTSAALHNDTLAVGADRYTTPDGTETGAVYTFERNETGEFEHEQTLIPDDEPADTGFGRYIDLHQDTLLAGARNDNALGWRSGAAYVFERAPTGDWSQSAKLTAPDGEAGDIFGTADVAVHEDMLAVPALGYDLPERDNTGAVYTFTPNATGTWTHQQTIVSPDAQEDDRFGFTLALTPDELAVATSGHAGLAGETGGAIYTHTLAGDTFAFTGKLLDGTGNSDGFLGHGLALDNGTLFAGSPATDAGINAGDRIVGVDGEAVANASELDARLDGSTARRVTVELADGSERTIDRALQVTAVAADSPFAAGGVEVDDTVVAVDGEAVHTERGFREAVGDDDVATIETDDGDTVTAPVGSLASVAPGGPFADAGAPTDRHLVVTRVGGERVYDHDDVSTALAPHDPGDEVTVVADDGDDREEYAVTLGSADGGAYLGIRSALGASGVATDSLGVRSYPTDRFLAMFTGDAGGSIPGKLLLITLLPFLSVVDPTVEFNFAGFVGANAPFYEVTGPLGALGEPVVFLAANLLFWTGWINLQLGLFNCIPAFPLDGGRILRAATESVVSRLPLPEKRTVTRMVTTSVGLIMLVALLLMLFGPQLLN